MLTRKLTRRITQALTRKATEPGSGGAAAFDPASLFASGEQGAWYDPSDFSTMFQDSAGTTPVTAVGQSVGRILDKSGRGNHATQADAAKKPLLQQDGSGKYYLAFDGVDDYLVTGNINFTSTDKMTALAGARNNNTSVGVFFELASSSSLVDNGAFVMYVCSVSNYDYAVGHNTNGYGYGQSSPVAPLSVATSQHDSSISTNADTRKLRINGASATLTYPISSGVGAFGNHPLYIGSRAGTSLPFNGHLYQLIVRGAATPLADIVAAESFTADKTGVTL